MLVSHRKKFIYLKTMKTAGTSVEVFFEPYCKPPGDIERAGHDSPMIVSSDGIVGYRGTDGPGHRWFNHMTAKQVRSQLGPAIWNSYFKFCVIRNPFDRLVSLWWMNEPGRNPALLAAARADLAVARAAFSTWITTRWRVPTIRRIYSIGGRVCVEQLVRYERLTEDLRAVCARLGIEDDPAQLPRLKSDVRQRPEPFADYYTQAARARVERALKDELRVGDYSFEA